MINFLIGAESLDFVISGATKIETSLRTLPQVFLGEFFSCKFFSFFSPPFYQKQGSDTDIFL